MTFYEATQALKFPSTNKGETDRCYFKALPGAKEKKKINTLVFLVLNLEDRIGASLTKGIQPYNMLPFQTVVTVQ